RPLAGPAVVLYASDVGPAGFAFFENAFVFERHHFDELPLHVGPAIEQVFAHLGVGVLHVGLVEGDVLGLAGAVQVFQDNHAVVAILLKRSSIGGPHVGASPAHAGCKVAAGGAKDDGPTARHVLAGVVSHPFDHRRGTRVPHAEPFGRAATDK